MLLLGNVLKAQLLRTHELRIVYHST
jgi:hypothetical protein